MVTDFEDLENNSDESERSSDVELFREKKLTDSVRISGGQDASRYNLDTFMSNDSSFSTERETYDEDIERKRAKRRRIRKYLRWLKIILLGSCWCVFTVLLMLNDETEPEDLLRCVPGNGSLFIPLLQPQDVEEVAIYVRGSISMTNNSSGRLLYVNIMVVPKNENPLTDGRIVSDTWTIYLLKLDEYNWRINTPLSNTLALTTDTDAAPNAEELLVIHMQTNTADNVPLQLRYEFFPISDVLGAVIALLLLCALCVLIIGRLVHFTIAAMFTCTLSIGMLSYWLVRPPLSTILSWLFIDRLMLIFSVTIIVAIIADSGMLDYLVVVAYRLSNGHIWPMLNCMLLLTVWGTAVLDTTFTLLIIMPVQIKLCDVLELSPGPVLMCLIVAGNIAVALTPFTDPMAGAELHTSIYTEDDISYVTYMEHMTPAVLIILFFSYLHLRLLFYNSDKMSKDEQRLMHVLRVWRQTANTMTGYSKDEQTVRKTVMSKTRRIRHRVRRLGRLPVPPPYYEEVLDRLEKAYKIHNKSLYWKCVVVLCFIVTVKFLKLLLVQISLPNSWIMLLGVLLLLVLADIHEIEGMLARIDWSTMIFLASVYILQHNTVKLGLGVAMESLAMKAVAWSKPDYRMAVALIVILWLTGFLSAIIVELPVTSSSSFVVQMIYSMNNIDNVTLPRQPLVWAMLLGMIIGCNGTIMGATINIVIAGAAEKHGYNFSFWYFFIIGFPIMIQNLLIATAYLLICHVVFQWH